MTKRTALTLAVFIAALALGACSNTLHGVGRDIKNTGQTIENAF
jgi:predicted small secreted protein